MIDTHFTDFDLIFLITGLLLGGASILLFLRGKVGWSLGVLVLAGFSLRLWMAFIDPFVNIWDEQFHALVAKNLAQHICIPTLIDHPLEPTSPSYWVYTEVWLHKPPLFLWQMAMSIKFFGATEWAIRIPTVVLSTLMIPAVFRMGKLFSGERTGYILALLVTSSNILININSGFLNTDQNDAVFVAYICFSFWSWMEYMHAPRKRWIMLTGFFVGAAILTKWLPGAMVFGAWFIAILSDKNRRTAWRSWVDISLASVTSAVVAAPWFLYAANKWPEQFKATLALFSNHLGDDLGHPGEWWYHFDQLAEQNGILFCVLIVLGIVVALSERVQAPVTRGAIFLIAIVFTFYAFISTRMPLFCVPLLPLLLLFVAHFISRLAESGLYHRFRGAKLIAGIILVIVFVTNINDGRIEQIHTNRDAYALYRPTRIHNRDTFIKALEGIPENSVVFNCGAWNAVPCMFYVNCTASDGPPSESQIVAAKQQQRPVYVFDDGQLPVYVLSDSSITILKDTLIRNGF